MTTRVLRISRGDGAWIVALLLAGCATPPPVARWAPPAPQFTPTPVAPVIPALVPEPVRADPPAAAIPAAPPKPLGVQEVSILVDALPLRADVVSFVAVERFLLLYAPFTANKALIEHARTALGQAGGARSHFESDLTVFKLTRNVQQIAAVLKAPAGNHGLPFLYALHAGIADVQNVILDFNEQSRGKLSREQAELVAQQIDGSSSIASQNLREVEAAIENFKHAVGFGGSTP